MIYTGYAEAMGDTTTIRISRDTHDELRRLATDRQQTVAQTVSRAVRLLQQDDIGRDFSAALTDEEESWLDAEAG